MSFNADGTYMDPIPITDSSDSEDDVIEIADTPPQVNMRRLNSDYQSSPRHPVTQVLRKAQDQYDVYCEETARQMINENAKEVEFYKALKDYCHRRNLNLEEMCDYLETGSQMCCECQTTPSAGCNMCAERRSMEHVIDFADIYRRRQDIWRGTAAELFSKCCYGCMRNATNQCMCAI